MKSTTFQTSFGFSLPQDFLINLVREGVVVASWTLQPLYLNLKAQEICGQLWNDNYQVGSLPPIFSEMQRHLIRNLDAKGKIFIFDHSSGKNIFRIRAFCLAPELEQGDKRDQSNHDDPWLLFFVEDRDASLREELKIEQQKYSLTARETEILQYFLQAYTYQEIADVLQISLNTVKFHAKNIYAKKRGYLESEKVYFEI